MPQTGLRKNTAVNKTVKQKPKEVKIRNPERDPGAEDRFVLSDAEKAVLYDYYFINYQHWADRESTSRRLAKKALPNAKSLFMSESCANLPMTPENWLKRIEIMKERKLECRRRAKVFRP